MAIELYPHNQETYEKMTEMFKASNRVGVVQPTGTGKSFLYLKWVEDHPQDRFAVLSPSTEIFTQLQEYADSSGAPELLDSVQMISYQALLKMNDEEVEAIHPDKMVLDEFHRTGAEQWGPSLQRLLDANPQAQVLGASATPVRYLDDSKDMASELFDRNLAVEMTLGEAVQQKILPTPKYVPVWYDIDGKLARYENDISKISNQEVRKELEEKLAQMRRRLESSYGAKDIFQKHMLHDHGKFIVFCRDKVHLEEMQRVVPQWLAPVNENVRCYVSISAQEDKDLQLQTFKEDKDDDVVKLLFTIDRLNEGVHVKGIDGVIMLRPTISPIIYLQQMGRALAAGSKAPLIFDLVNNYQSVQIPIKDGSSVNVFEKEFRDAMDQSGDVTTFRIFEDIVDFTFMFFDLESKLYLSFNEKWEKSFNLLEKFIAEFGRFPKQIEVYECFSLGIWCDKQKAAAKASQLPSERYEKLKAIGLLDNTLDNQWEEKYALLEKFIAEFGRFPKTKEVYEGVRLAVWCYDQKVKAQRSDYPPDRVEKLNAIGLLDFTLDNKWEEKYALLEKFIAEFGRFPKKKEVYEGVNLGVWCQTQKLDVQNPNYPSERYEKLKAIGILDNTLDNQWNVKYVLLEKFIAEFGRFPKQREVYEGVNLGSWCQTQKLDVQNPNYPSERYEKLKAIGILDNTLDNQWEEKFTLLEKFIAEFGRFPKKKEVYEGVKLGSWCTDQKIYAKRSKLSPERFEKLKAVGLLDDTPDTKWKKHFALLEKFIVEFNRFPKQIEVYEGVNLGIWCSTQKKSAKASKLSPDRFKKLESIGLLQSNEELSSKPSLDCLIRSAVSLTADSHSFESSPVKEFVPDR